jgi:hemolysin III
MRPKIHSVLPSDSEEFFNTVTHAVGVLLSIIGAAALITKAIMSQNVLKIFSAVVFGGSLVLLYTSSTFYHAMSTTSWKSKLKLLDHSAIFILIAGTYTPFLLVALKDQIHVSFIISMWGIALFGITYKLFAIKKFKLLSTLIYLAMGWMAVFKIKTFYHHLPLQASMWILAGGLFYSLGTIFYSMERMKYHHAIWHLFVLGGSVSHFIAIYYYIY